MWLFNTSASGDCPRFWGNSYIEQVQQLLSEHEEVADIAIKFDIKPDTLSKAIRAGRLHKPAKKRDPDNLVTSKSERSSADRVALMGVGAQDVMGRVAASVGDLESGF